MSTSTVSGKPGAPKPGRRPKTTGGVDLGQGRSMEAKRMAAAILEVLAGARTPAQAATALSLSVPRYYQIETRALQGLLAACEPRPKGRSPDAGKEVAVVRQENQRLQREITRQQALVRAAQRSVGLPPSALPSAKLSGKKPRKRRVARALSVAKRLVLESVSPAIPAESSAPVGV